MTPMCTAGSNLLEVFECDCTHEIEGLSGKRDNRF